MTDKLIGPKPDHEYPVFTTPFRADGVYVKDFNGALLLRVDSANGSFDQDKLLAEEIVRVMNKEHDSDGIVKIVDGGGDDWFELHPDQWFMGGDSGTGHSYSVSVSESLARSRARTNDAYTLAKIEENFGIEAGSRTVIRP